jgi:hypothetical protein
LSPDVPMIRSYVSLNFGSRLDSDFGSIIFPHFNLLLFEMLCQVTHRIWELWVFF